VVVVGFKAVLVHLAMQAVCQFTAAVVAVSVAQSVQVVQTVEVRREAHLVLLGLTLAAVAEPMVVLRLEVLDQLNQMVRVQVAGVVGRLVLQVLAVLVGLVGLTVAVVAVVLLEELQHLVLVELVELVVLKFIHGDLYVQIRTN
jgi:hypothetical protein